MSWKGMSGTDLCFKDSGGGVQQSSASHGKCRISSWNAAVGLGQAGTKVENADIALAGVMDAGALERTDDWSTHVD